MHEVKAVANNDKWELVRKLCLLQEVFDLFGIIVVGLPADAFNLANLTSPCSSLDILEVDLRIITQVYDRTEVIIKTFERVDQCQSLFFFARLTLEALEGLEHFDKLDCAKNVGILGCDLDHDLQILANIYT
jgi:hypothetical protein